MKRVPLKLKPGHGEKRALEERLLMRNPALFSPVLRAPARFPGRWLLLRRALRQALGALNRRDLNAVVARRSCPSHGETERLVDIARAAWLSMR